MNAYFILLVSLGVFAQQRRIDLSQPPWNAAVQSLRHDGDIPTEHVLEQIAVQPGLQNWERAHAWRWAGLLAQRQHRLDDAHNDLVHAHDADPTSFDGKMSLLQLGEIAMEQRHWFEAKRYLEPIEFDPDPIVRTYAVNRLTAVRERTRRLTLRYGAIAILAIGAIALAIRMVRRARRPGFGRSFGWALLVTEMIAIVAVNFVPKFTTLLAQSGSMAFAIPFALVIALLWATRDPASAWWKRVLVLVALAVCMAAGLYVALDYTWWAVEHPIAE